MACEKAFSGMGFDGYAMAIKYLINKFEKLNKENKS
jgi:3-dehydroquinate dehydratase